MNIDTLYLKLEIKVPFQIITTSDEIIVFENKQAPFALYSKYYLACLTELLQDEKKKISIDYLSGANPETMQIFTLKEIQPCLGNFVKIKTLSSERLDILRAYYGQDVLQHPVLSTYFEFMLKIFFQKKAALEMLSKKKQS